MCQISNTTNNINVIRGGRKTREYVVSATTNEYILVAFNVIETVLGARNTEVNNKKSLHSKKIAPTCHIEENTQENILTK